MNVVIVGARGMLGQDLAQACAAAGFAVAGFDLPELDLTRDDAGLERLPDADGVINCAAYTDVDGAETHRDLAFAVNASGAGRLARWCRLHEARLVHLSTDYVFDGKASRPYRETDPVGPLGIYGQSKLAGEQAVLDSGCRALVVRTQSLFGLHGRSFIRSIVERLDVGQPLRVVADQTQCPTYTRHLADGILRLLRVPREGIVHVSASGTCSWHEFACAIAARVRPGTNVAPVPSTEFPRPARRPAYSVLDKGRYEAWTGSRLPTWIDGMNAYLDEQDGARS